MGDGLSDAKGIADREHDVADQQFVGIGKIQRREFLVRALEPQYRQIAAGVLEHDFRFEFTFVRQRNLDLIGAFDDVNVGHHQA